MSIIGVFLGIIAGIEIYYRVEFWKMDREHKKNMEKYREMGQKQADGFTSALISIYKEPLITGAFTTYCNRTTNTLGKPL